MYNKYEQVITKDSLRKVKQDNERLEQEEQGGSLQYQVKSKTHATNQLLAFCERKSMKRVMQFRDELLTSANKENNHMENASQQDVDQAVLDKKFKISELKQKRAEKERRLQ